MADLLAGEPDNAVARVAQVPDAPLPLSGAGGMLATTLAAGTALYALYWVVAIVQPQGYRLRFLLGCLILTFILYPFRRGTARVRVPVADWLMANVAVAAIVWPLIAGVSTFRAVFWATALAFALSFVRRETALTPRKAFAALDAGGRGVLSVAATTATAGIIVGVGR
jgi:TRAP-type uncharacterized transport system fused permease subunit